MTTSAFEVTFETKRPIALNRFMYAALPEQVKASNGNGLLGEYWYDGDGKRVKKYVPPSGTDPGETTIFVYDAAGKLAPSTPAPKRSHPSSGRRGAVYSTVVAAAEDARVAYLTADHLGSPRINTDRDGKVTSRHDYHPYGEEIITAQRTSHAEYTPDSVRKQFTGYERDGESGLDFAQARNYLRNIGRFGIPDPENAGADETDPKSWNGYVYVINNPLNFVDPDGLIYLQKGNEIQYVDDAYYNKHKDEYEGWSEVPYGTEVTVGPNPQGMFTGLEGTTIRLLRGDRNFEVVNPPGVEPVTVLADHGPIELTPIQQLANGVENQGAMWFWRPVIYTAGTAEMAVLSAATAAGAGAGGGAALEEQLAVSIAQRGLMARRFIGAGQTRLLRIVFSEGRIPPGLSKEAVKAYIEIAKRTIQEGLDKGVQAKRVEQLEHVLKQMK